MRLDLAHLSEADNILLNRVAEEIREPYNELIARLSEGRADNIDWIVSSIASRSIFLSPLVWHCYHLGFLSKKFEQGVLPDEIIVHDRALAQVVGEYTRRHHPAIKVRCVQSPKQRMRAALKPMYQLTLAARLLGLYAAARRFPSTHALPDRPITLVDTFVLDSSFAKGDYSDRYYPGMREALGAEELEQMYYVPTFIGIGSRFGEIIQQIRRSSFKFLLKEDVLQPSDYRFAFTHFLRRKKIRRFRNVDFFGFDIAPLVNRELSATAWDPSSILALLIFRFVERLKERGVRLRFVVDWFENQAIDRALHAGLRLHYPDVATAGYAGYIISPVYHLYVHPTASEYAAGIVPKEAAVIGEGHGTLMKEFCPGLPVQVAPAFRFSGVWRERKFHPEGDACAVLIALPITLRDSVDILGVLLPFCTSLSPHFRFRVKAHPSLPKERIAQALGGLPQALEFVEGDFNEWLERSHVLVGNTSSTCVEALAKGVPVVVVGSRNGITQNPVPATITSDIWSLCYTPDEVAAALERYRSRDEQTRRRHEEVGKSIRAEYFEPVTREGTRRFLKLPLPE